MSHNSESESEIESEIECMECGEEADTQCPSCQNEYCQDCLPNKVDLEYWLEDISATCVVCKKKCCRECVRVCTTCHNLQGEAKQSDLNLKSYCPEHADEIMETKCNYHNATICRLHKKNKFTCQWNEMKCEACRTGSF